MNQTSFLKTPTQPFQNFFLSFLYANYNVCLHFSPFFSLFFALRIRHCVLCGVSGDSTQCINVKVGEGDRVALLIARLRCLLCINANELRPTEGFVLDGLWREKCL